MICRYNKIERLFLDAITANNVEMLETMITDENAMFDVLGDFFYHEKREVRVAALEVYERRALISYDIEGLLHEQMDDISAILFKFRLPESHPNSAFAYGSAVGGLGNLLSRQYKRFGAMAAFDSFADFETHFASLIDLFRKRPLDEDNREVDAIDTLHVGSPPPAACSLQQQQMILAMDSGDKSAHFQYILNVAVRMPSSDNDNLISQMCGEFCQSHSDLLNEYEIRRVTFIVLRSKEFPKYFTFRARNNYMEDLVYRHLEPALAFQLELNRLKNYDLRPVSVSNHKMHLYFATAKKLNQEQLEETSDYRFFIRSIIRHSDFVTSEASFEFVRNEGERLLLEALDELEVASTHPQAKKTDGNHIFLNFVPTVTMHPFNIAKDIEEKILNRYAHRLLKLKVKYAEISVTSRPAPGSEPGVYRICISNEAGYLLKIHIYKIEEAPDTGILKFFSFSDTKSGHFEHVRKFKKLSLMKYIAIHFRAPCTASPSQHPTSLRLIQKPSVQRLWNWERRTHMISPTCLKTT